MVLPPESDHPGGEQLPATRNPLSEAVEVDTFAGKLHIECVFKGSYLRGQST